MRDERCRMNDGQLSLATANTRSESSRDLIRDPQKPALLLSFSASCGFVVWLALCFAPIDQTTASASSRNYLC
jgi:hypothetical protein